MSFWNTLRSVGASILTGVGNVARGFGSVLDFFEPVKNVLKAIPVVGQFVDPVYAAKDTVLGIGKEASRLGQLVRPPDM